MSRTKLMVTSLLVLTLLLGTAVSGSAAAPGKGKKALFSDVDQVAWALPELAKMNAIRVIRGYGDGTFRPMASLKRQDAVLMAVRLVGLEEEAEEALESEIPFKDADKISDYALGAVSLACSNGWLDPLFSVEEHGNFQPQKSASRLWVTVLLVSALESAGTPQEPAEIAPGVFDTNLKFKDADKVPEALIEYVARAVELGLIKGFDDGTLQPDKPVTRAQMAALLARTDDNLTLFECKKCCDEVEGKVVSVLADQIAVQTKKGETVVVEFAPQISIFVGKEETTWEAICPGDEVEVKLNRDGLAVFIEIDRDDEDDDHDDDCDDTDESTMKAKIVSLTLPETEAEGSITVYPGKSSNPKTFALAGDLKIEDGLALEDIEPGMIVKLTISNSKVIEIEVED